MRTRGVGPVPCKYMLVSDYPGYVEARTGEPLTGKTGEETNRYLDGQKLPAREEMYLCNLIREYNPANEYTQSDVERDEGELIDEIRRVNPKVIITLGRWSARWFLGDVDLDEVQGLPWLAVGRGDDGRVVFPIYNPAAGFRSPEVQAHVAHGFHELALYLDGKVEPRELFKDPYPSPTYIEITDPRWMGCLAGVHTIDIDTEGYPDDVWSIQFSIHPGTAYLVRMGSRPVVLAFLEWLLREQPRVVFHGSLHDLSIFRSIFAQVGLPTDALYDLVFDDTQIMAYLLQLEPRGLKPNCVRHCNMRMQSYDEVLGSAQHTLATDYLVGLFDCEQADYAVRQHEAFEEINRTPLVDANGLPKRTKDGTIRLRKTTVLPTLPRTDLHKAAERVLRSPRAYKLWGDQQEDIHVAAYTRLGEMPRATLNHVPFQTALHYACRDADGTGRLLPELSRRVDALGLRGVYDLELATYPMIDRMMMVGVKPNLPHFERLSWKLQGHIEELQAKLYDVTGDDTFNANSGDQVAAYLFGTLALPESKRTKGGRASTNDIILEGLEQLYGVEYPEISTIRAFRETYKLKYTFVDRIPDFVSRWPHDGRVHCTFRTTTVITGRLSASGPNLLAQPEHGKFAPDFKRGWVAEPGHVLASWDESQIELRVLAHLSQDPVLLAAYREGRDLHSGLAQRIFGGKEADYKKGNERLAAKTHNFGLAMGMTCHGLMLQLRKNGIETDEQGAQEWIDTSNTLYKQVPVYKRRMIAEAKQNGFVRCLSGRIRYIGGMRSWDRSLREEAERFAFSTPIQEGAQWIMKQAEAHVWGAIRQYHREGRWIEPLMQVHDSIKLEMQEGLQREINGVMQWAMVDAVKHTLSVPLAVEGEWGLNFKEMEGFK